MHRHILGLAAGDRRVGDHINWDKLDNRRVNLRVVTKRQNMRHRPGHIPLSKRPTQSLRAEQRKNRWMRDDPRFSRMFETPSDVRVIRPGDADYPL